MKQLTAAISALLMLTSAAALPVSAAGLTEPAPAFYTQDSEDAYLPILSAVKIRLEEGFSNYQDENDILYGVLLDNQPGFSYLWYMGTSAAPDNSGYAIIDLNGDGIDELVIGGMDSEGNGMIYDLYTQHDGTAYHIAASGERDSFSLTTDGMIMEQGSESAFASVQIFYEIGTDRIVPSVGYRYDSGVTYIMDSYTSESGTFGSFYSMTWKETSEEERSFTEQKIPFTAFADISGGEPSLGDFNSDSAVDASDAADILIAAARFGAGETGFLNDAQTFAGDSNADGAIDAGDAANILLYAAYTGAGGSGSFTEYLYDQGILQ